MSMKCRQAFGSSLSPSSCHHRDRFRVAPFGSDGRPPEPTHRTLALNRHAFTPSFLAPLSRVFRASPARASPRGPDFLLALIPTSELPKIDAETSSPDGTMASHLVTIRARPPTVSCRRADFAQARAALLRGRFPRPSLDQRPVANGPPDRSKFPSGLAWRKASPLLR
jgi:hypothetical protein